MSGHEIERLTLKIEKNVNKTEIDHIGAYICGHELSELVVQVDREAFSITAWCEGLKFFCLKHITSSN